MLFGIGSVLATAYGHIGLLNHCNTTHVYLGREVHRTAYSAPFK